MSYISKYTGQEIDNKLDKIEKIQTSYKEKELLSAPIEYDLGINEMIQFHQDLALIDNLADYNELVISYDYKMGESYYTHNFDMHILTSNIVFHNSDTQLANGERRTIILFDKYEYFLGFWFKDTHTIHISHTNTRQSELFYNKIRIRSIKGIKY